jgi:hypothetical protein
MLEAAMTDESLLWNAPRPEPRKPMAGEHLWSMRNGDKSIGAELRDHGGYGIEIQFRYQGEFVYGRRWATRELAVAEADDKRRELERGGWQVE